MLPCTSGQIPTLDLYCTCPYLLVGIRTTWPYNAPLSDIVEETKKNYKPIFIYITSTTILWIQRLFLAQLGTVEPPGIITDLYVACPGLFSARHWSWPLQRYADRYLECN